MWVGVVAVLHSLMLRLHQRLSILSEYRILVQRFLDAIALSCSHYTYRSNPSTQVRAIPQFIDTKNLTVA